MFLNNNFLNPTKWCLVLVLTLIKCVWHHKYKLYFFCNPLPDTTKDLSALKKKCRQCAGPAWYAQVFWQMKEPACRNSFCWCLIFYFEFVQNKQRFVSLVQGIHLKCCKQMELLYSSNQLKNVILFMINWVKTQSNHSGEADGHRLVGEEAGETAL